MEPEKKWDRLGRWVGGALEPLTGLVAGIRHARMFHPDGLVYAARVEAAGVADDLQRFGERLAGPAMVRLSSAWWRGRKEWPDVLGLAIRFAQPGEDLDEPPGPRDQDLLFATVRFPWTTPLAPLGTRVSSFLWNHFHAVSPFEVDDVGRVKFRLRSPRLPNHGMPRAEHLAQAVAAGAAIYDLEVRRLELPFHRREWERVAHVTLEERIAIDQAALRFSPFRDGRGVHPTGFVHHLRPGAYAGSQHARPT